MQTTARSSGRCYARSSNATYPLLGDLVHALLCGDTAHLDDIQQALLIRREARHLLRHGAHIAHALAGGALAARWARAHLLLREALHDELATQAAMSNTTASQRGVSAQTRQTRQRLRKQRTQTSAMASAREAARGSNRWPGVCHKPATARKQSSGVTVVTGKRRGPRSAQPLRCGVR